MHRPRQSHGFVFSYPAIYKWLSGIVALFFLAILSLPLLFGAADLDTVFLVVPSAFAASSLYVWYRLQGWITIDEVGVTATRFRRSTRIEYWEISRVEHRRFAHALIIHGNGRKIRIEKQLEAYHTFYEILSAHLPSVGGIFPSHFPIEVRAPAWARVLGVLLAVGGLLLLGAALPAAGRGEIGPAAGLAAFGICILGMVIYACFRVPGSCVFLARQVEASYLFGRKVFEVSSLEEIRLESEAHGLQESATLRVIFAGGEVRLADMYVDCPLEELSRVLHRCYSSRDDTADAPARLPWPVDDHELTVDRRNPAMARVTLPRSRKVALAITGLLTILLPAIASTGQQVRREARLGKLAHYPWSAAPSAYPTVELPPATTDEEKLAEAEQLVEAGYEAFEAGRFQEAISAYDRALALNPRYAEAYLLRGYAYLSNSGNLDQAIEEHDLAILDATKAMAADPAWGLPYALRAMSYQWRAMVEPLRSSRLQWLELALSDCAQAIELRPDDAKLRCDRAAVLIQMGQCQAALSDSIQCYESDPVASIGWAHRCAGLHDQAVAAAQAALLANPDDPYACWQRGLLYLAEGNSDRALDLFDTAVQALEGESAPGELWYDRASAEYHLGRFDQVKESIERGKRNSWLDWGAPYYYLGMVYLSEGKTRQAAEALRWAEQTLDQGDPLLAATRAELQKLEP